MSKTYTVEDFAKLADVEIATARVMLRRVSAKKKGKTYEFSGKEEMQKLIDKARAGKSKSEKKAPAKKAAKKKAPAKKKPAAKKKAPKVEEGAGAEA